MDNSCTMTTRYACCCRVPGHGTRCEVAQEMMSGGYIRHLERTRSKSHIGDCLDDHWDGLEYEYQMAWAESDRSDDFSEQVPQPASGAGWTSDRNINRYMRRIGIGSNLIVGKQYLVWSPSAKWEKGRDGHFYVAIYDMYLRATWSGSVEEPYWRHQYSDAQCYPSHYCELPEVPMIGGKSVDNRQ